MSLRSKISRFKRVIGLSLIAIMAATPLTVMTQTATAAQETPRSLTISTAQPSATASYTFAFTTATASAIQSLQFQACTLASGACIAPTGLSFSTATWASQSGFSQAVNFARDATGAGNCTPAANVLCAKRTAATSEATGAKTIVFNGITNQNTTNCAGAVNCTFFVRMTNYSDTGYATAIDNGQVASSTTQLFTVNATVQEQLSFCIGATTVDDMNTTTPATCGAIGGTSLSLGALTPSAVSISPVTNAYNGDSNNGLAELSTNAANGAAVTYDAVQQTGTNHLGTLRVAGATCNSGTVNVDQCINAVGVSKATLTAGTEAYGMTIAGINCKNVTAYTCTGTATANLTRSTNYNCDGTTNYPTGDNGQKTGTTTCSYAWDESGTAQTIASSTTVVGGEAMILKFAATPNLVTPTGSYTAKADFVATPTF